MLVQYDPGSIEYVTDPIPLGRYDRVAMHLLIRYLDTPMTTGNAEVSMQPQVAIVPSSGWVDAGVAFEGSVASTTPIALTTSVNGEFVRFKFKLLIKAGETGLFRAIFDSHVRLEKS